MLTIVHQNPIIDLGDAIRVDRKFDEGIRRYCEQIPAAIVSVHPRAKPGTDIMDAIEVERETAPYRTVALDVDDRGRLSDPSGDTLRGLISDSALVYGQAYGAGRIAKKLGTPYIGIVEYDLGTQITVATCDLIGPARKFVRATRAVADYFAVQVPELVGAQSIHCNGYPIYEALNKKGANCLLYLDSRVSSDMVIAMDELLQRLAFRPRRRWKLMYSGRFVRMKGVCDVITTAVALRELDLDFELHLYGQGPEKEKMQEMIADHAAHDYIYLHGAVPFPVLFDLSKAFDLFVCCHIQSDPSCTYLEAHGAGLPIAGYENRMWSRLCRESGGGVSGPVGEPRALASRIFSLLNSADYDAACISARNFASKHTFEAEFDRRIADIRRHLVS